MRELHHRHMAGHLAILAALAQPADRDFRDDGFLDREPRRLQMGIQDHRLLGRRRERPGDGHRFVRLRTEIIGADRRADPALAGLFVDPQIPDLGVLLAVDLRAVRPSPGQQAADLFAIERQARPDAEPGRNGWVAQRGRRRADRPTGRTGGPTRRGPRPTLPSDPLADPAQESLRRPGRRARAELGRAGLFCRAGKRWGWPQHCDPRGSVYREVSRASAFMNSRYNIMLLMLPYR